ncbi:MAG TPA: hypothetical protein VGD22_02040 [Sphingobacteriaceae bacterium]
MENQNINLKPIQMVHLAMCIAPTIFLTVVFILNQSNSRYGEFGNDPLYLITPAMAAGAFITGQLLFKTHLSAIDTDMSLSERLAKYQSAFIIRQALIEGATIFNIVAYFLLGHSFFAAIALVLILLMFTFRPTKFRASEDLQLNYTDLN